MSIVSNSWCAIIVVANSKAGGRWRWWRQLACAKLIVILVLLAMRRILLLLWTPHLRRGSHEMLQRGCAHWVWAFPSSTCRACSTAHSTVRGIAVYTGEYPSGLEKTTGQLHRSSWERNAPGATLQVQSHAAPPFRVLCCHHSSSGRRSARPLTITFDDAAAWAAPR